MEDPEQLKSRVGERIAELRRRAKRTQAKVAEAIETTTSNYQRIEYGGQNLTLETLAKIANAIGVPVIEFFGVEPRTKPKRASQGPGPRTKRSGSREGRER